MVSSRINPFSHPGMRCKSFTAGFVSEYRCNTSGLSNPCPSVMHRMPSIVIKCPSLSTKLYISLHRPCIGTLCTTVAPGAVHEGTQVSSTLIGCSGVTSRVPRGLSMPVRSLENFNRVRTAQITMKPPFTMSPFRRCIAFLRQPLPISIQLCPPMPITGVCCDSNKETLNGTSKTLLFQFFCYIIVQILIIIVPILIMNYL